MSLAAVDGIDDAIDATKHFLIPFSWGTWIRLGLVVMFLGGGGGTNIFNYINQIPADPGSGGGTAGEGQFALSGAVGTVHGLVAPLDAGGLLQAADPDGFEALGMATILVIVLLFIALALILWIVSEVMQFVFTKSLIEEDVHVRRYFRENLGNGIRLLLFRIFVPLFALLVFGLAYVGIGFGVVDSLDPNVLIDHETGFLLLIVAAIASFFLTMLINGFTVSFAVPIMIAEDVGVVAAWARLLPAVFRNFTEYLLYIVLNAALGIGVGIIAGFGTLLVLVVLAIPYIIAFAAVFILLTGLAQQIAIVTLAVLAVVSAILAVLFVRVPLVAFLRYYAMFVLGDTNADIDPIPEIRSDVRD